VDQLDAARAAGVLEAPDIGLDLVDELPALVEEVRPALGPAEATHPAVGVRVEILEVDDEEGRLRGVEGWLLGLGNELVVGIVGHGGVLSGQVRAWWARAW
jgi:hypothetical protein